MILGKSYLGATENSKVYLGSSLIYPTLDITSLPYGAVINTSPTPETLFIGSPSICKSSTGRYIASHDLFVQAPPSGDTSVMFYSDNLNNGFTETTTLTNMFWGKVFANGTDLYIIGVDDYASATNITISKSVDDGLTWGTPVILKNALNSLGFLKAPTTLLIKDGHIAVSFGHQDISSWAGGITAYMLIADLTDDLTLGANWTLSNGVSFNSSSYPLYIGTNGVDTNTNKDNTQSKGFLEGNLIEDTLGNVKYVFRLEQTPNSNYNVSLDVAWNSGTPKTSTIGSTFNYSYFQGGQSKFSILYDAVSSKYWSITNVNKYKYWTDNRMELYLMSADEPTGSWTVHEKVMGITPSIDWEAETVQYGVQYCDFIVEGNDIIAVSRTASSGANSYHNADLFTYIKIENFRTSTAETYVEGSLIIDENSSRLEDVNGIAVIQDQSKYYNSPFMLNADNTIKPNWITNGIQFDGASYLRARHNEFLNIDNGFSVFAVIENLQSTAGLRILSKSSGVQPNDIQPKDYTFSTEGLTVGGCYSGYTDLATSNNYILSSRYDDVNNYIYNSVNGVNRGLPSSLVGGTWNTDHIEVTSAYPKGNTAELWVGARENGSLIAFNSKILALHIIPRFITEGERITYEANLNANYSIY